LAAAAAADKGILLSPEALAEYAVAIDPEEGQAGEKDFSGEPGNPGQEDPQDRKKKKEPPPASGEDPEAGALRKNLEALPARRPLLDLLNRLPGKNGQRWIVFPFSFSSGGVAFKVSLRILLNDTGTGSRLILDILSQKGRWFFCISGYGTGRSRADIGIFPPLPPENLKKLERELREVLGEFVEEIYTENREKSFLPEEESWGSRPFLDAEA
jgi:hypothetical protein